MIKNFQSPNKLQADSAAAIGRSMLAGLLLGTSCAPAFAADPDWVFHLNEEFEQGYFYSIAVRAGDMLYIGGVTAVDEAGNEVHAEDPRKQMEVIYKRLEKILTAHGATFRNVVDETIYYRVPTGEYLNTLDVRAQYYDHDGIAGPTASGVRVMEFTSENILIELKAVAYIGK